VINNFSKFPLTVPSYQSIEVFSSTKLLCRKQREQSQTSNCVWAT